MTFTRNCQNSRASCGDPHCREHRAAGAVPLPDDPVSDCVTTLEGLIARWRQSVEHWRGSHFDREQQSDAYEECANDLESALHAAPSPAAEIGAKEAFFAAYHAQWIWTGGAMRWIFDPLMKPGDPEHCWQAWLKSRPSAPQGAREQEK